MPGKISGQSSCCPLQYALRACRIYEFLTSVSPFPIGWYGEVKWRLISNYSDKTFTRFDMKFFPRSLRIDRGAPYLEIISLNRTEATSVASCVRKGNNSTYFE